MKKMSVTLSVLITLAGCSAGDPDTTAGDDLESTQADVTSGTRYNFGPQSAPGSCMDVAAAGKADGTNIHQWQCNGTVAQAFRVDSLGNGQYKLVNPNSNKCVDVAAAGTADGTNIHLWTCNGTAAQAFRLDDLGNGRVQLVNPNSNKCVDVSAASTANGTNIQLWTCNGTNAQIWNASPIGDNPQPPPPPPPGSGAGIGGVLSEGQFNQMFPNRNAFYTYQGLVSTAQAYAAFANSSDITLRKREAAAFLANVGHETGDLIYVEEINKGTYCDYGSCGGCPAGAGQYFGRGPIQLSWNCNYLAAGQAIGLGDRLVREPWLVSQDPSIAWKTGVWYWMTSNGPNWQTAHAGISGYGSSNGFGQTVRSINGSLECDGRNPGQVESRVQRYRRFCDILGVSYGDNLYC